MTEDYSEYLHKSKAYYNVRFGAGGSDSYQPHAEEELRWYQIAGAVKKYVTQKEGEAEILDIGCGRGWMSNLLAGMGRVLGVDLSNEAIETARSRYPGVEFACVDASDNLRQTLDRQFDVVVSSEVIEHVLKQEEYLQNIVSLLKPGGMLVLTTPNGKWKQHFYHDGRSEWAQPYELWLTAQQLTDLIHGSLDVSYIRTFNASWVLDLPSFGWPHWLGNRFFRIAATSIGMKGRYLSWLEQKGYGINLLFVGTKPAGDEAGSMA